MRATAAALAVLLRASAMHGQGTAIVSGVVRDEVGAPVREVLISIDPDSLALRTRTAVDGSYRVTVPVGRYEVRVVRIGYKPQSHTVTVSTPATELNIVLQAISIRLDTVVVRASRPGLFGTVVTRGIALLPHEPRALRGARIEAVNSPHNVTAGADGRFNMPQLPSGTHGVMVSLKGYVTRLIPVSIPPDGGLEMTVVLDSLYAEYQRWDEDALRGITRRQNRAISPATFIPQHDIDPEAKNLRDGIRFAHSLLTRGVVIRSGLGASQDTICVYVNGKPRPDVFLQDIDPADVEALEVYPRHTLIENVGLPLPPFPSGSDCEKLWMVPAGQVGNRGSTRGGSAFPAPRRTMRAAMGNAIITVVVWTRGRR